MLNCAKSQNAYNQMMRSAALFAYINHKYEPAVGPLSVDITNKDKKVS